MQISVLNLKSWLDMSESTKNNYNPIRKKNWQAEKISARTRQVRKGYNLFKHVVEQISLEISKFKYYQIS